MVNLDSIAQFYFDIQEGIPERRGRKVSKTTTTMETEEGHGKVELAIVTAAPRDEPFEQVSLTPQRVSRLHLHGFFRGGARSGGLLWFFLSSQSSSARWWCGYVSSTFIIYTFNNKRTNM